MLTGGSDRDFRYLVHGLFGFLARHEQIRAGHAKVIGLAGIEYTVLISIAHLSIEGDVSVMHETKLHQPASESPIICTSHKRTDQDDRRRVTLTVSAKGLALLEKLAPTQRQINDIEFGCLSRDDFHLLLGIVDRLIECGDSAVALQAYVLSQNDSK